MRKNQTIGKYVYTEKGEARALSIGQTNRRAGQTAMFAGGPVDVVMAVRWLEKGYICRRGEYDGQESQSDAGEDPGQA